MAERIRYSTTPIFSVGSPPPGPEHPCKHAAKEHREAKRWCAGARAAHGGTREGSGAVEEDGRVVEVEDLRGAKVAEPTARVGGNLASTWPGAQADGELGGRRIERLHAYVPVGGLLLRPKRRKSRRQCGLLTVLDVACVGVIVDQPRECASADTAVTSGVDVSTGGARTPLGEEPLHMSHAALQPA